MKRKTIDAMHEIRLGIVQVVIPLVTSAVLVDSQYPDLKHKIVGGVKSTFDKIKPKEGKIVEFREKE